MADYLGSVLQAFGAPTKNADSASPRFPDADVKSRVFYGAFLQEDRKDHFAAPMLLTSLLCATNMTMFALPSMMTSTNDAFARWFVFKWRLVTLVHAASSIHALTSTPDTKNQLKPNVMRPLTELRRRLKPIRGLQQLRNALVHYGLARKGSAGQALDEHVIPLDGSPFAGVDGVVERALVDISDTLTAFVPRVRVREERA